MLYKPYILPPSMNYKIWKFEIEGKMNSIFDHLHNVIWYTKQFASESDKFRRRGHVQDHITITNLNGFMCKKLNIHKIVYMMSISLQLVY